MLEDSKTSQSDFLQKLSENSNKQFMHCFIQ